MSMPGDDDLGLFARIIAELDEAQLRRVLQVMADMTESNVKTLTKAIERAWADHHRREERNTREHVNRISDVYDKQARNNEERLKRLAQRQESLLRQAERRDIARLQRKANREDQDRRRENAALREAERRDIARLRRRQIREDAARDRENAALREAERRDIARLQRMQSRLNEEANARDRAVRVLTQQTRLRVAQIESLDRAEKRAHDERLQNQKQADRLAAIQADHHVKQIRNIEREAADRRREDQKAAHKQQLQAQKAADSERADNRRAAHRRELEQLRATYRREQIIFKGVQDRLTIIQREGAARRLQEQRATDRRRERAAAHTERMELEQFKAAERLKLANVKAAQDRIIRAEVAAERERASRQEAAQQRSLARTKSFWSINRSLAETTFRFLSSSTQAFWSRRFSRQQSAERREIGSMRSHESRKFSLLRSSYADQNALTQRAMARQTGIVAAAQTRNNQGIIGGFLNVRNALLGIGAGLSARAIFGPGIDFNLLQQRARAALATILDGANEANRLFDQLLEFSRTSPFPLQNFIQATQKLAAFGFEAETIVPTLDTIQDAVAAFGGGAQELNTIVDVFAKIQANGKITGEELNRLGDVGVNALAILAEQAGMTAEEMRAEITAGAVDSEQAISALTAGMEDRFDGAASAVKETWVGATDRVKAAWRDLSSALVAPFISPTGGGLAIDWANQLADGLRVIQRLVTNIMSGSGVWDVVRSGLLGVATAMAAIVAVDLLGYLRLLVQAITPMRLLALGVIGLAGAFAILLRHVPPVGEAFEEAADIITSSWGRVTDAVGLLLQGDFSGFAEGLGAIATEVIDALAPAAEFISERATAIFDQVAPVLIDAWDRTFEAVAGFIRSGGLGRIRDAIVDALSQALDWARERLGEFFEPTAIGLGVALAALLGPAGPLAALVIGAIAGAVTLFRDEVGEFLGDLPLLILRGLRNLGEFLGGTVLSAIFSEVGIKIALALAAGVSAAAGAFLLGLIDGLRQSIPSAAAALAEVGRDLLDAMFDSISDLAVVGDVLRGILTPVEVVLRGILPTLEVFANILGAIPTPIYAVAAALFVMVRAWRAFQQSMVASRLSSIATFFVQLPGQVRAAGAAMQYLAAQTQSVNATFAARAGGLTVGQRAMGRLAQAAGVAGGAVSAVGAAMPAIGAAATIGLPIALGLWETAKARTQEWKQEVKELGAALNENSSAITDFISEGALEEVDGYAKALNEAGVSAAEFTRATTGTSAEIGEMFASFSPALRARLDELNISLAEFGAAAAEGDQAVGELGMSMGDVSGQGGDALKQLFKDIPESLREVVDQSHDAAEAWLEQRIAAGDLTDEQVQLWVAIKEGEAPTENMISLAEDVASAMQDEARAIEDTRAIVDRLIEQLGEATSGSDSFRDALDRVTGSAIEVGQSRQSIQSVFDSIREGIAEGQGLSELAPDFLSAAEGIVGVFETLSDAGRPREAMREYQRLREQLIQQYVQTGLNREQAEEFTNALIPPVEEIGAAMDDAQARILDGLRSQRRNLRGAIRRGDFTGDALAAAEEALLEIDIALASYTPTPLQVDVEAQLRDEQWDAVVDAWERRYAEEPASVVVRPVLDPTRRDRGEGIPGSRGFAGGGGMGGAGMDFDLPALSAWSEGVMLVLNNVRAAFAAMKEDVVGEVVEAGKRMEVSFSASMRSLYKVATSGATRVVNGLTSILARGGDKIAAIVGSYVRRLASSINPLLAAIGSSKIEVGVAESDQANMFTFARGGIPEPRLARPGDGPIVHVYNEGASGRGSQYGEAYIPFDPTHRSRARDIADRSVGRLGGRVQWFREGGYTGGLPNLSGDVVGLVPEFARRLSTWATSLGQHYTVNSGFRSYNEQVVLYQRYLAGLGPLAAPPGSSMHEFGLASDGNHWSALNPANWGLHFPVPGEAWHVEPVEGKALLGDSHGWFMGLNPVERPPKIEGGGWLGQAAQKVMDYVYRKAFAWAASMTGTASAPSLGALGNSVREWIMQAIEITNVPTSWAGPLGTLVQRESGGNPRAYNSVLGASGIAQTIPSTFAAYSLPGLKDIWNPVHNLVAAIRYILDRYGSIFNVGQAMNDTPTGGYRIGGIIDRPTLAMMGEDNRREVVLPLENKQRLRSLLHSTGLWAEILSAAEGTPIQATPWPGPDQTSRSARSGPMEVRVKVDMSGIDQGIDPALYDTLGRAVRSGVADGIGRADAIEERW